MLNTDRDQTFFISVLTLSSALIFLNHLAGSAVLQSSIHVSSHPNSLQTKRTSNRISQ